MALLLVFQIIFAIKYMYTDSLYLKTKTVINFCYKGVAFTLIAGMIWITSEKLCNVYPDIFKYLFGHAFWHIGMPLGVYICAHIILYFDALNNKCKVYFENEKWYHWFIPMPLYLQ